MIRAFLHPCFLNSLLISVSGSSFTSFANTHCEITVVFLTATHSPQRLQSTISISVFSFFFLSFSPSSFLLNQVSFTSVYYSLSRRNNCFFHCLFFIYLLIYSKQAILGFHVVKSITPPPPVDFSVSDTSHLSNHIPVQCRSENQNAVRFQ
jgi:hypothetical protein